MSGVDDKIVSMQFDNEQFRRRIGDTLGDLDALTRKLDGVGANSGLDQLDKSASRFHLGNVGSEVEGVSAKFLAMATIGITALSNITNRAVSAGLSMVKSFTIAPVTAGFSEFETKIGSIQTILANTARFGTQLPEVSANLDKLNTYADKTIYSFGDMTRNIGLFTNAGIKIGDATSDIKGFSNVAAASGTNAEAAAGAAYQLSQALSAGTVRLMDWRSLTNAGMGNANMKDGLIQIATAMGTITKSGTTATKIQSDFNGSLEKGWLSADVMSKYLKIMSGDMSDAEVKALGLSDAQVKAFRATQVTAEDAATKVRTFTQLVGTIKEAVGSGWAETFQTVLGNFDESTKLFTDINNSIGAFVQHSADARNNLLQGWAKLGGRTELINAFKDALKALGEIIKPIKEVFRDFFPKTTVDTLMNVTHSFAAFAAWLHPLPSTVDKLKRIFAGLFSIVDIGINLFIEIKDAIFNLIGDLRPAGDGIFGLAANLGDLLSKVDDFLINGGKLHAFFLKIDHVVDVTIGFLRNLSGNFDNIGQTIQNFFGSFKDSKEVENVAGRVSQRFDLLREASQRLEQVWDRLTNVGQRISQALDKVWGYVSTWISELGHNMAAAMAPSDFNGVVDIVNVGLLGGLVLLFKKFLSGGLNLDLGQGVFGQIKTSLEQVTKTLSAMQAQLKAKALMEIAIALGVLTASIVVLSLIDSAALAKAMVAITVGFGELVGTMSALDKVIGSSAEATKMGIVAIGLNLLASSMVILAVAIKIMSTMSWEELVKGLGGIAVALALMIGAIQLISTDPAGLISAGIAMTAIATAMTILGGAVKIFASMSWGEMAKGLVGIAGGLTIIVLAMNFMPPLEIIAAGLAMIPLAIGLNILAGAVALFGSMSWSVMGKGLLGTAGALLIIAGAMNLMPVTLPIIAIGMVILATALTMMAGAVALMGAMKLGTLAKGIGAIAVLLLILSAAMQTMQGALPGAAAMIVTAGALSILARVIETLGNMSLKELATGIGGIAAVLIVLGLAALVMEPVIPALMGLGVALALIGAGFALFGLGALLVAKSFQAMAAAGEVGVKALINAIVLLIKALPTIVAALIESVNKSAETFLQAGTTLLKIITVFLLQVLDTIIKLAPKVAEALVAVITSGLLLMRTKFPDIVATGLLMLLALLQGIDDNIVLLTTKAIDIILKFADTLVQNEDKLINAAVNLLIGFLKAFADRAADISGAGLDILLALIKGVADNVIKIVDLAVTIITNLVTGLIGGYGRIIDAGATALVKFLEGLGRDITKVADKATDVAIAFVDAIGTNAIKFANAAGDALVHFLNGMADAIRDHSDDLNKAGLNIAGAIIDGVTGGLASKAAEIPNKIGGIFGNAIKTVNKVIGRNSPSKVFRHIALDMIAGTVLEIDQDTTAESSIVRHAEGIVSAFQETLKKMPHSLDGLDSNPVITPVLDLSRVKASARGLSVLMSVSTITPDVSFNQARVISTTADFTKSDGAVSESPSHTEVNLEQNNYSPKALSTSDIYRNTKSQLAVAKEVLKIK